MAAGSPDPLSTSWAELLREKRSLAAIVRDAGRLCIQDSVDIVLDVCDELANAHANGIVHGDLGLHRVRTMWPRKGGDFVDIWALDADDTGAIDFRAAFQAPALAPEQRSGRVGDVRSDIWAVGAILHALIGGAPPMGKRPVREMLPGAPRALVSIVEQCLADDPEARPRSVDDVAGALASFASNSPERFQQLARRRIASLKAKHVPAKVTALSRLDDAALQRESAGRMAAAPAVDPRMVTADAQPFLAAAPVIPPAPQTQPTVGALRAPTRPSYSDAQLPNDAAPVRKPSRPSYSEASAASEWPQIHGVPSMSIAVPTNSDAPTKAQRGGTLPVADPLPPTVTAAAMMNPRATAPLFNPSMYPPSAAFPSAMPATSSPSITPPPVEVSPAMTPAPFIPPAPNAYRQRSYHPPSFGPMSIDTGADDIHIPLAGRVPSFADLAEYREAKRASRRSATVAVIMAAAVLIIGLGFGARVLKEDRENMRAAEAAAAHAPAPPPPAVTPLAPAATPAAAPAPATSASAKPETTEKAAKVAPAPRKTAPAAKKTAPAAKKVAEPKSDAIPKESEFSPNNAFSDAIGKKDPAPANALSDGLK
ncbi:MAG: hypothetical protein U0270_45145 [Labilithrix sp.]